MPESFIVTIMSSSGNFQADLEIPSTLPFDGMKAKLLEILKILSDSEFRGWQDFALRYKNRVLTDGESLADVGAFDGSRLTVLKI